MTRALLAIVLLGCTSETPALDGGDVDATVGGSAVDAPAIPWLAEGAPPLAPCPEGWMLVDDGTGSTFCDPFGGAEPIDCPDGEAHFPGAPGCTAIGASCAGDFSGDLPTDRTIVYVLPGAAGGDGSETMPYGRLDEFSRGSLPRDSVVALGRGTHDGPVAISRGVVLWGACAAETFLRAPDPPAAADGSVVALAAAGEQAELRNLTVGDSPRWGVRVAGADSELRVSGVVVAGALESGAFATDGARIVARDLVVRDTSALASSARPSFGVGTDDGAMVEIERAIIEDNVGFGVFATDASMVELREVIVRDTRSLPSGRSGRGINVQDGVVATIERSWLARNHESGIFAARPDTVAALRDVVVRDTMALAADGRLGRGLFMQEAAHVVVEGGRMEGSRDYGVLVSDPGTRFEARSLVVMRTLGQLATDGGGSGLGIVIGASATVVQSRFERNRDACVFVHGDGSSFDGTDLVVRDTASRTADARYGFGLAAIAGASTGLERAVLARNHDVALFVTDDGTALVARDVVVNDTNSQVSDGTRGRALSVQSGAHAEIERGAFHRNREVGVLASGATTTLTMTEVRVNGTRPRACGEAECTEAPLGMGLLVALEAAVTVSRFVLSENALCGVQLVRDGELDLMNGEVSAQPIGVCLQIEGYDPERLTENVRFLDNGTNLQATDLPIPDAAAAPPMP